MTQRESSEFLNINEAARFLGVNPRTVYRHVWSGKLPALRAGGLYRIRRADLEAFLAGPKAEEPAGQPILRCGACLRVLPSPSQVAGVCGDSDCGDPLCSACWAEGKRYCAIHEPSPQDRLTAARQQLARGEIEMLLPAVEARLRELSFLNRIQARLTSIATLLHPLSEEALSLQSWDCCIEQGDERAALMRLMNRIFLDAETLAQFPLNAWLIARPPLPKAARGRPFEIHVRCLSRLEVMAQDGFDTRPLDAELLTRVLLGLDAEQKPDTPYRLALLAAPAGWEAEARSILTGKPGALPFVHTGFQAFLYDLPRGELVYNPADERAGRYADLFIPRTPAEEFGEAVRAVEKELLLSDSLTLEHAAAVLAFRPEVLKQVFQRLAQSGKYALVDVPQLGQAIVRK